MEITEEQRKRAEANRLAALAKRKASSTTIGENPWKLFRCRKISPEHEPISSKPEKLIIANPIPKPPIPQSGNFRVTLEICSPDSFSITPEALPNSTYPGEIECLQKLNDLLSFVVPSHYTQTTSGGTALVYKLGDYDMVLKCLKKFKSIDLQEIPWRTLNVIQKFLHSFVTERWIPCMPEHLSDDDVDELIKKLPKILLDALLPFQIDGLRFGLRRGGCCLIADEMGLGKTIQAIAIAGCFMNEGHVLVVCPAILRFSWAEELERWLPFCSPTDIHLVFGHQDNPAHLTRCPRVVVISYTMLCRLRKSILDQEWALLIVDESHHIRCTKKPSDSEEIKAVLDVAAKVKHKVLLSGTPSLSRLLNMIKKSKPYDIFHQINILWPGLLGRNKYEFAKSYCAVNFVHGAQGKLFQDYSKGTRLEELNVLLKQTVMIRRLKEHVLAQLPPKRRQVIRLMLSRSDITSAIAATRSDGISVRESEQEDGPLRTESNDCPSETDADEHEQLETSNEGNDNNDCDRNSRLLSNQELGIAKLSGFREWLSIHPIVTESNGEANSDMGLDSQKTIIFAHHLKVLDGVQEIICEKGIGFVRIDGNTLARDRQSALRSFQSSSEVKIAIIGITAGGFGLDFSLAKNVVFLELPRSSSDMLQAEDRAHRRGQTNAVNIYIFCAKDTSDESHWRHLNKSLHRVSSVMNGKYDAVREIECLGLLKNPLLFCLCLHLKAYYQFILPFIIFCASSDDKSGNEAVNQCSNQHSGHKSRPLPCIARVHSVVCLCLVSAVPLWNGFPVPWRFLMNVKFLAANQGHDHVDGVSDLCSEREFPHYESSDGNDTENLDTGAPGSDLVNNIDNDLGYNLLSEKLECDELSEVEMTVPHSSAINLTMQPVGEFQEISGKSNHKFSKRVEDDKYSSTQTYSHTEDGNVYDIEMDEDAISNRGLEDHAFKVFRGCSNKLSAYKMDAAIEKDVGLEHITLERILVPDADTTDFELEANRMHKATSERGESEPADSTEVDKFRSIQPEFLRFEVSQYTGRIHLYTCIPGRDSRPRLLLKNFRPEEVESLNFFADEISKKTNVEFIKENLACKSVILAFIKEWNYLRPIEQRKLLRKPLQLPLVLELCYLKESINHETGGLLKGGSKRRATPLDDISYPLPENAVWKKISLCSGNRKKATEYTQGWTLTGEPLCKLCQTPCMGKLSKTPEYFEDLFCNLDCYQEYRIRTSQRSLRKELFNTEHGVCRMCNLDCHKLIQSIRPLSATRRKEYIKKVAPKVASRKKLLDKLVSEPKEGNAWHADHIKAVYQGGGECNLENMRTLCVACHYEVTAAQRTERRLENKKNKELLRRIQKELKDSDSTKKTNCNSEDQDGMEMGEDDELLIKVPGSSYSEANAK